MEAIVRDADAVVNPADPVREILAVLDAEAEARRLAEPEIEPFIPSEADWEEFGAWRANLDDHENHGSW